MKMFTRFFILLIMTSPTLTSGQVQFTPPNTPQVPVVDDLHGFQITDNYQWLEDKKNQEVIDWTRAQHDYSMQYLNKTSKKIAGLQAEIEAYIDRDITGPNLFGRRSPVFLREKERGTAV